MTWLHFFGVRALLLLVWFSARPLDWWLPYVAGSSLLPGPNSGSVPEHLGEFNTLCWSGKGKGWIVAQHYPERGNQNLMFHQRACRIPRDHQHQETKPEACVQTTGTAWVCSIQRASFDECTHLVSAACVLEGSCTTSLPAKPEETNDCDDLEHHGSFHGFIH